MYERLERLAQGGMAEIILARRGGPDGELVVIKQILPQLAADRELRRLFADEIRTLRSLSHPNIVRLVDEGVADDGAPFMVLEYLSGADLRRILTWLQRERRGLPLAQILYIVAGLAEALEAAHRIGVVHRDLSPSNVFITWDGEVKLLDFGIAAARAQFSGKRPYMSPEQCRRERLDGRSDVFSLGVLLYELTTGMRLFRSDPATEPVPPPSTRRDGYPARLEEAVLAALARDPAKRCSALELREALAELGRAAELPVTRAALAAFLQPMLVEDLK